MVLSKKSYQESVYEKNIYVTKPKKTKPISYLIHPRLVDEKTYILMEKSV